MFANVAWYEFCKNIGLAQLGWGLFFAVYRLLPEKKKNLMSNRLFAR